MRKVWLPVCTGLLATASTPVGAQEIDRDQGGDHVLRNAMYATESWREPERNPSPIRQECDSDLNGAMYGTLAGAAPGFLALITRPADEARLLPAILMVGGGFLGFWIGLAVDSLDCEEDRPE